MRGLRWALVVVSVLASTFLFGLDNTITANVQPAIIYRFDSVSKLPWISVAFLAGSASTTLFWGAAYGQANAKWQYIACICIFEAGSAVCGAAPTMNALIVGRAICGLGGTGMYTGVLSLLSAMTSEKERASYFGLCGLVWGAGTVLGPIIGGAFASSSAGWRWAFYINICVAAVCAPVYLLMIPSIDFRPGVTIWGRVKEIDFLGTILLSGTFVSLLMGISFGGVVYHWSSGQSIALFVIAGVLAIAFFVQQGLALGTTATRRAFPIDFLRQPSLCIVFILQCCSASLTYITVYFIPLYFQFVRGDSAIISGVKLLPLVVFLVAFVVVTGFAVSATGRYNIWFFVGGSLSLVGSALLYTVTPATSDAKIYGYSILVGAGMGCFLQLPISVVQSMVSPTVIPKAIGFATFAQLGGPTIMLSVVNAIFLNEASGNIARQLPSLSRGTIFRILSGIGSHTLTDLSQTDRSVVLNNIVSGLSKGYIVCMTAAALTVILTLVLSRGNLVK